MDDGVVLGGSEELGGVLEDGSAGPVQVAKDADGSYRYQSPPTRRAVLSLR